MELTQDRPWRCGVSISSLWRCGAFPQSRSSPAPSKRRRYRTLQPAVRTAAAASVPNGPCRHQPANGAGLDAAAAPSHARSRSRSVPGGAMFPEPIAPRFWRARSRRQLPAGSARPAASLVSPRRDRDGDKRGTHRAADHVRPDRASAHPARNHQPKWIA
jgi:hypothetical protein